MRKSLITIGIVAGVVLIPVLGMAISPTRDLILGMAPDAAVLQLADQIDANRVDVDQKTSELQSLIDTQRAQIAEQQSVIDGQKTELDKQKADVSEVKSTVSTVQTKVDNSSNCDKLLSESPECKQPMYQKKSAFDEVMDDYKRMDSENGGKTNIYDKNYREKYPIFQKCQEILSSCS